MQRAQGRGRFTPESLRCCGRRQSPCREGAIGKQVQTQGGLRRVLAERGSQAGPPGSGPGWPARTALHRLWYAGCSVRSPVGLGVLPRPTPSLWTPLTPTHPRPLCGRPCSERVTYVESHACDLCIQRLSPSVVCPRSVLVRVLWPSGSPLCARATLLIQLHVRGCPDDSHLWKFARRAFVSRG